MPIWAPAPLFGGRYGAGRKNRGRGEIRRQLAGQALEESHDVGRVGIVQGHPKLHARHDLHGPERAPVRDTPQTWYPLKQP